MDFSSLAAERLNRIFVPSIFLSFAFFLCLLGLGVLYKLVHEKYEQRSYYISLLLTVTLASLSTFLLPISPVNDGYAMARALYQLLNDGALCPDFERPYFSFFANNKVALVFYWSIVSLVRNVEIGIRIANFLCVFASAFFFSLSIGSIFGNKWRGFGLLLCIILFPFIILTSPYVYPIGIALSSTAFYLGISKKIALKPLFFLTVGVLFLIRPAAAVFIFVFFSFCALRHFINRENRKGIYALGTILMLFASLFIVQLGVGAVFFHTGFHPYPNLTNGATNWTLDIGTRFDGANTGLAVYAPFGTLPEHLREDEIAIMQHRLFAYFIENNPDDHQAVVSLSGEIRSAIMDRASSNFSNFSNSPSNIMHFYARKAIHLFGTSNYGFYFYRLNATLPSFAWQAHQNLEQDSETHILALIIFLLMSFVFIIVYAIIKRKFDGRTAFALSNLTGCASVVFIMLTLTEVGQRSLLDIYIPATFAACAGIIFILENQILWKHNLPRKLLIVASSVIILLGLTISTAVYSANNVSTLRSIDVSVIQSDGNLRMEITLPHEPPNEYYFRYGGQVTYLSRNTVIETTVGTRIYLHTPNRTFRILTTSGWR